MTKSKFIEYAGEVQDYCLMLTKTSDVTGVEYFESEFASPLDIMEKMIFDQFDKSSMTLSVKNFGILLLWKTLIEMIGQTFMIN